MRLMASAIAVASASVKGFQPLGQYRYDLSKNKHYIPKILNKNSSMGGFGLFTYI